MIALAQGIIRRGGSVTMAGLSCPDSLVDRLQDTGIVHRFLAAEVPGSVEDGMATIAMAKELGARWIVTDGYHFGYDFQKQVKDAGFSLLCADDHGYSERWHCDAILNQNLDAENWASYANDFPDAAHLLGSSFCLLREEFITVEGSSRREGRPENVLVSLGGSDPDNVTENALKLLEAAGTRPLNIRVLVGPDNTHLESIQAFKSKHRLSLVQNASNMPEQFEWADVVISAAGSTCWEWLHAGLPGAVVTIADNQVPISRALSETRPLALGLGWGTQLTEVAQVRRLAAWMEDPDSATDQAMARKVVDGRGADRVAAYLDGSLRICIATAGEGWMAERMKEFVSDLESRGHRVSVVMEAAAIPEGDILLLLSFWGLVRPAVLKKNTHNLVVHGSDLPQGRGWSPVTSQIL
ncbi:MAG: UDP-2,4-diacetamido-2,4,6-trideoxy-beta-L-altropyranose hydrolase, partial [Verrucomicrobia bacterium]|nr:UDP-2,4-diacetamido-2,4,6-trideoxy-beta-L-altropyranose hydrolase [Verrucomicrobiota bacterium]